MDKEVIFTKKAPNPVGPYSQAVKAGDFLFVSGTIAIDPKTGKLASGGLAKAVDQIMSNIKAVIGEVGADFKDIVKTTIFLTDMSKFPEVNEAYGKYFPQNPPARSTVEVSKLPVGVEVEIEAIVAIPR
jgi:2-iminobutanoate/2-iminopropanoate deaminase